MIDSTAETLDHIRRVNILLIHVITNLLYRCISHDSSKLYGIEKDWLDRQSVKLNQLEYSPTYLGELAESDSGPSLEEFLKSHYKNNSHHPEHYENGINGMTLIDLVEMTCDWKAAGERHLNGSFKNSLDVNIKRFNINPQLAQIIENTGVLFGWI